ncbi:ABC transporter substrate-binding protein [Radiobacillus sp. PE A8.2]|uniref:ABC transporter substrate-binding protein n=1 Tax=Radiobacillus sp. PE A8.2 TaxID=3380349 RepID=UPI003890DFF1
MKKFSKKYLFMFLVLLFAAFIVSACNSEGEESSGETSNDPGTENEGATNEGEKQPEDTKDPVTLQFAAWSVGEEATKAALEEMAASFEAEHPNVTIEFVGIPFGDIKQQTFVMASSGNAPDIIQTHSAWFSTYATSDIIVPLDDLLGEEYVNDIMDSFKEDYTYDGNLMGVPWAPSPYVLYRNKELFAQAGLPDRAPETYEEMLEFARAISDLETESGEPVYGLGEATEKLPINGLVALRNIYSFGGSILDESGNVNVNTPEVIETLEFYKQLAEEELTPQGAKLKDLRNLFSIGRLGMYADGYYGKAVFRNLSGEGEAFDEVWEASLIPANVTGDSISIGEAHGLVVTKDSEHQELAAAFIKHLTNEESIVQYHELSDVLTARKSLSELDAFNDTEFDKVLLEQMNQLHPLPANNPGLEPSLLEIAEAVQKVSVGMEDPAKVAEELDEKLKGIFK